MIDVIRRFLKSADFYKSLTLIIATLIPILISEYYFANVEIGFAIALGVFYNSPTNIAGSVKHRTIGMLISIILTTVATLLTGYAAVNLWILLPVLALLTFSISFISVFGFRASLVSLAGMLAVVISFANSYINVSVFEYSLLIGLGGLWYLLLSSLFNFLNPKLYVEELLSDTMDVTAKYLDIRARLLIEKNSRKTLSTKLFEYQADLSTKHETLRAVILTRRRKAGFSNRTRRKLLIFIELVDILELAIANPIDYETVDALFEDRQESIEPFVNLIFEMANQLNYISKVILRGEKVKGSSEIRRLLKRIRESIDVYKTEVGLIEGRDGFYILVNLFEYQAAQAEKLNAIERVLNVLTINNSLSSDNNEEARFLTPQDYGFNKLRENFSIKSSIFRHSLRLAIVMNIGFLIGEIFSFQNPYWILITLLVIMRPSYGLTKERMKHRVIGTIIGAVIALILVYLIQDTFVFGVLAAVTLVLALSLVQLNYKTFAVFITLHIVFMYALYSPDVLVAVQYRVIDTIVGGVLAILSNLFLFPTWEFMSVSDSIIKTLDANSKYLNEIDKKYHSKEGVIVEYKLSRKKAFLAMGDLNAAFQRMTQDPKSKQKYFSEIYKIVELTNTFLSSLASLGTFINSHKTTAVSKAVDTFVINIKDYLLNGIEILNNTELTNLHASEEVEQATLTLEKKYNELTKNYDKILLETNGEALTEEAIALEIQEAKLVLEQLSYLYSLSKNIVHNIKIYQDYKNKEYV